MTSPRPWSVGQSARCPHRPRCANIFELESGVDVTGTCSGLSVADAVLIVAAVNAVGALPVDLDRLAVAIEAEWRRVAQLAADALRAQGGEPA